MGTNIVIMLLNNHNEKKLLVLCNGIKQTEFKRITNKGYFLYERNKPFAITTKTITTEPR